MKKRYEEVSQNPAYIQQQLDEHGINAEIRARQLYHDREEVTVHIRRWWAAVGGVATSDNVCNARWRCAYRAYKIV